MAIGANSNVNGAAAALAALQALQISTSTPGSGVQGSGSSGPSSTASSSGSASVLAQDPFVILSGAAGQTGESQSASALAQGASLTDAAGAAAQLLGELLHQIQQTATAAADPALTSASRSDLSTQFSTQLSGFSALLAAAQINGQNLLNGSLTASPTFAGPGGGGVSVQPQDLTLGGPLVSLPPTASVATSSAAASSASLAGLSITAVEAAIGQIYDQGDQINGLAAQLGTAQVGAPTTIASAADGNSDAAGLIALQLQQSLSAEPSLSLSNPASRAILSLFRG